jgi:hypothetical protein
MGTVLLLVRRWQLPFGSLTLLCGINMSMMMVFRDEYRMLPVALLTGLLADLLIARLKPSETRLAQLRLFAFAVPAIWAGLYFLALAITEGIGWSPHLWIGTWIMAGIAGVMLSFPVVPPAVEAAS